MKLEELAPWTDSAWPMTLYFSFRIDAELNYDYSLISMPLLSSLATSISTAYLDLSYSSLGLVESCSELRESIVIMSLLATNSCCLTLPKVCCGSDAVVSTNLWPIFARYVCLSAKCEKAVL